MLYKYDLRYSGFYASLIGGLLSTFRCNLFHFKNQAAVEECLEHLLLTDILLGVFGPLKMGPTGCPETSLKYYLLALLKYHEVTYPFYKPYNLSYCLVLY